MNHSSALLSESDLKKIKDINNRSIDKIINTYIDLCAPASVKVISDLPEDSSYLRKTAISRGEEFPLNIPGHTVHFDGYSDQGRDTEHTRILITDNMHSDPAINSMNREQGLDEILQLMKGICPVRRCLYCFL
jgi:phosphoenolpyruvate carboxykinase (GTP)